MIVTCCWNLRGGLTHYQGSYDHISVAKTFFVGLSHKFDKNGQILNAFSDSTRSGTLITAITNALKQEPIALMNLVRGVPLDENGKIRYPNTTEKEDGFRLLVEDIRQYQPTLVYLFGKEVSDYVIKHSNAEKLSETEYRIGNTVFILVTHPSYIAVYKRDKAKDYMKSIITRISGC